VIPAVLLVELTANGVLGARLPRHDTGSPWGPNLVPLVHAADYMREGALARAIADGGDGRYVTLSSKGQGKPGRRALLDDPKAWAALGDQRSILFQIPEAGGYNPIQLVRYWEFVRVLDHRHLPYNAAYLVRPVPPVALDLLQIRWLVAPTESGSGDPTARLVANEGAWGLYQVASPAPRASVVAAWTVVASAGDARRAVTTEGFDPSARVVLERDPGFAPAAESGTGGPVGAVYRDDGPGAATVLVDSDRPAVVLIRNPFGPGWHATVDGRPAPILAADFVDQGVPVMPGHHVIRLAYEDPSIGIGAAVSAGAALVILLLAGGFAVRARRRERHDAQTEFATAARSER
jgi:hypothetical protein